MEKVIKQEIPQIFKGKKIRVKMENTQQKVRQIPIFVEGRDEPVLSRQHETHSTASAPPPSSSNNTSAAFASAESSSGPNHHSFTRAPMFGGDMGFGQDIPMPSGSIFDRAKDFPVRDFFNMRSASPRRSESPIHVHQPSRSSPGPQQRHSAPQSSQEQRQVPIVPSEPKRSSTPQRQAAPPQADVPEQSVPPQQKAIEDSITKIQKIQASVLELMSRVEKFDGTNQKEFALLDELLMQNLLKLDDINAEGKENIKNARREAIKCINSLISLLEAKNDALKEAQSKNESDATKSVEQQPEPTENGVTGGASKNSSYDNVKQAASNNSVNTADASMDQDVPAEVSLETKVQEALQKQEAERE